MRRDITCAQNGRILSTALPDFDHVAGLHSKGWDVRLTAVYLNVAVADNLPRLRAAGGQAPAVDDIVQPALQDVEQVFAGDALYAGGLIKYIAELGFRQAIVTPCFLLLAKLQAVADNFGLRNPYHVDREQSCAFQWHTSPCGSVLP